MQGLEQNSCPSSKSSSRLSFSAKPVQTTIREVGPHLADAPVEVEPGAVTEHHVEQHRVELQVVAREGLDGALQRGHHGDLELLRDRMMRKYSAIASSSSRRDRATASAPAPVPEARRLWLWRCDLDTGRRRQCGGRAGAAGAAAGCVVPVASAAARRERAAVATAARSTRSSPSEVRIDFG